MDRFRYIFGFPGMNFATTPNPAGAGAGSGSPPPDSSGGTGGAPASSPTGGQPGTPGTGALPAESPNIKQLRDQYEATRGKLEPWEKLGIQPSQVQQFQGVYQRVYDEAAAIGRNLGYADDEILEALHEDPVATLDYLRNQAFEQEGGGGGEPDAARDEERRLQEMVNQGIERGLGPIQQRENIRMTNEANALFERTVHGLAVEEFKKDGIDVANIPPDEMEFLVQATSEIMKYDEAGLVALKREGKVGGISKAFQEAKLFGDKYYIARSNRERARAGVQGGARGGQQQQRQQQDNGGKRPTLDEMIDDPSLINKKYQPGV